MGDSNKERQNNQDTIESLCYQALSLPWPSKTRDGVRGKESGIDGARAVRVLVGVLQTAWSQGSLTVVTGLEPLGYIVGLTGHYAVRDALYDLQELGWVKFEIGTQDDWSTDRRPKPSVIRLIPRPGGEGLNPKDVPMLTLDLFRDGELGTAGWWAATRIWIESRDEFEPNPIMGVTEVVRLTGMSRSRVKKLLPRMAEKIGSKVGSKYSFAMIRHLCDRGIFTDYKQEKQRERLRLNRSQKGKYDKPVVPQLWRRKPDGEYEEWLPLGFFESGRAYWSEGEFDGGDPTLLPRRKFMIPRHGRPYWEREGKASSPAVVVSEGSDDEDDPRDHLSWGYPSDG
jgi:hypothetical protein